MAQGKALEVWSGLPTWAKGIIAVGGLAIIYFTGRTIIKKINASKESKDSKESVKDATNNRASLLRKGLRPSFTETQYKGWANSIEQSFEGCDPFGNISWGADSPLGVVSYWSKSGYKVATIFAQLKNDIDFIDFTEYLRKSNQLTYFMYDNHMNETGHELLGELIARKLQQKGY